MIMPSHFITSECHSWGELNNCHMTLWSEGKWKEEVANAGFEVIDQFRAAKREGMKEGTMVIVAINGEMDTWGQFLEDRQVRQC